MSAHAKTQTMLDLIVERLIRYRRPTIGYIQSQI